MSDNDGRTVRTGSEEETEDLGARLGAVLPAGTVLALSGPLGAGKTAFARGVARGLGIDPAEVSSPTFTYIVDYTEGRLPFIHADLYRLLDLPEQLLLPALESIGLEQAIDEGQAIVLVEWWPCYPGREPERLVRVEIAMESGNARSIELFFRGSGLDGARRCVPS